MSIYEWSSAELKLVAETNFGAEGIWERKDIQRLLREQIGIIDERLMVVSEEFGEWIDSSRRIDLLCLDSDANLVVLEIKRTEDGGHMELQALRYAAMVSSMTFDQLISTYARFRSEAQPDFETAKASILEFLGWSEVDEAEFGRDTRIVLASADFSKELTTTVMWLVERGIDIRCVRLRPYRMASGTVLLDVHQIIPLPEASDFQTQIGNKKEAERRDVSARHDLRYRFWDGLLTQAKKVTAIHANRKPTKDSWIAGGIGRAGFSLTYSIRKFDSQVELWMSFGKDDSSKAKAAFRGLEAQKADIERDFGAQLEWQELPEAYGCRIRYVIEGGYKTPQELWPGIYEKLIDAMVRLDKAMHGKVAALPLQ